MTPSDMHRVVVLETADLVTRVLPDRPNLYIGITTRTPAELAAGLNDGKYKPIWARHQVVAVREDLAPVATTDLDTARLQRSDLIKKLRQRGYTVNRNNTAYRTYVINLYNPELGDPGKGYVYVGQTSKDPDQRLQEHLDGAVSQKGHPLAARKVQKYGTGLNHDLMTQRIYLTQKQALKAERRLADRLRAEGYIVEGGH